MAPATANKRKLRLTLVATTNRKRSNNNETTDKAKQQRWPRIPIGFIFFFFVGSCVKNLLFIGHQDMRF